MAIYYHDEMNAGRVHDHIETYSVKFWYTNKEGYQTQDTVTMWIETGSEDWTKITKALKKRYKNPSVVSVKYQ